MREARPRRAPAAQAAEAASKREEALEREVPYAREAAAKAEAKADAERRDVSRRIATARVRIRDLRGRRRWAEAAAGGGRGGRPPSPPVGRGCPLPTVGVSPPSSPVSARMLLVRRSSGGRRSANGGSDRSALEAVILSLELGKCETLLRESEQRAAYEARRHEATVGPLRLQLEHETAWWRSHLESEVGRLAAELEAQREASEANAASRLEVLRLELDKKDRAIMQHTHDVSALQQQVSTLRSALATTKRADQMDIPMRAPQGRRRRRRCLAFSGPTTPLPYPRLPAASALASSSLLPSNAFCAPPRHAPHYVAPPPRTNTSTYVHPASPLPPPPLEPTALQGCGAPPTARSYSPLAAPTTTPATDARYLPLSSGAAALAAAAAEAGGGTPAGAPPCLPLLRLPMAYALRTQRSTKGATGRAPRGLQGALRISWTMGFVALLGPGARTECLSMSSHASLSGYSIVLRRCRGCEFRVAKEIPIHTFS